MSLGIQTTRLYNLVPNRFKLLSNKRSAHHIHFDKIMHDIFQVFSKVKKMRFCRYMQGKESLLSGRFFQ